MPRTRVRGSSALLDAQVATPADRSDISKQQRQMRLFCLAGNGQGDRRTPIEAAETTTPRIVTTRVLPLAEQQGGGGGMLQERANCEVYEEGNETSQVDCAWSFVPESP